MYPGRVSLTPVPGQDGLYDMVRADQPTQEGTPLNKATLLSDGTAAVYGLGNDAVPDDVFMILGIGAGKYGYGITVQYPDGTPAAGLSVSGVTDRLGQPIKTDKNGFFLAVSTATSITFSVESPYFDISGISDQIVNSTGVVTKQTVEFAYKTYENYVLITSSQTIQFFKDRVVDFTAVGGGGGTVGWTNAQTTSYGARSSGGGGGYVQTVLAYKVSKGERITFNIGSGGQTLSPTTPGNYVGGNGGTTKVQKNGVDFLSALGGNGGGGWLDGRSASGNEFPAGGEGNGNGGSIRSISNTQQGENGNNATGFIFDEQALGLAGGGGGASGPALQYPNWINYYGGKPYGANGAKYNGVRVPLIVYAPTGPGGGAGGSKGDANETGLPPAGAAGGVYIRWEVSA